MSRPLRIQFDGAVYHVMNRGTARQTTSQTLGETARLFGLGSYGAVGWGCHGG